MNLNMSIYQRLYLKTYVTTNLYPNDVERKYGDYIRDRRGEMFNLIELNGESRR